MTNVKRYTYRLNKELFEKLELLARDYGISINAVINNILAEYFDYRENNTKGNVWKLIEVWEKKKKERSRRIL